MTYSHPPLQRQRALLIYAACAVATLIAWGCQPFEDLSHYPFTGLTDTEGAAEDTQATTDDTQSTLDDTQSTLDDTQATSGDTQTTADDTPNDDAETDEADADVTLQECTAFDPQNPPPEGIPVQCFGGGNKCCPPSMECNTDTRLCECKSGKGNCDRKISNGCEAKLDDVTRCGACDVECLMSGPQVASVECKAEQCLFTCEDGFQDCDGLSDNGCEAELSVNRAHCGACGVQCAAAQVCVEGQCECVNVGLGDCGACSQLCGPLEVCDGERCVCPPGKERCAGVCVDTQTNRFNCGGCTEVCSFGSECVEGVCLCGGEGGDRCDANAQMGQVCCGQACLGSGEVCCVGGCDGGTCCNGSCVNTGEDEAHCGACGLTCGANEVCVQGECLCGSQGVCPAGFLCGAGGLCVCPIGTQECMGECTDLSSSEAHCGRCGQTCPPPSSTGGDGVVHVDDATCDGGACSLTCEVPWGDCNGVPSDGCEVSLHSGVSNASSARVTHCGACGYQCALNEVCVSGACDCAPGFTRCGDECVNVNSSEVHCGQCDQRCRLGEFCRDGGCCFLNIGLTCR